MYNLRVLCRVVTYDPATCSILLVRNRGQKWWCAPGGGWEHTQETILECARREVLEEAGVQANILKLLYVQTLHIKKQDDTWLEQFWLAEPTGNTEVPQGHIDQHGVVDEARWFNKEEVRTITVYPEVLRTTFWDTITSTLQEKNRYLGHFAL